MRDDANIFLTCPYEESHRIEKYRMARHLTKCENSHPNIKLEECPYNTLHRIKPLEFQHHLSICEDRVNLVNILYESESSRPVESITVQEANSISLPLTENWDTDPEPVASYNPLEHVQKKNILYTPMLLSKSKKKAVKLQERERHNAFTNDTNTSVPKMQVSKFKDELEKPLRLPRNPPQALTQNKKESNTDIVVTNNDKKPAKENTLENSNKKDLENAWKSKYMDEDLITFTKIKNCNEIVNNSTNKDDNVEVTLNTTTETCETTISDFFKDLQKNGNKRCSVGRGMAKIVEMYKKSAASQDDFKSRFMNPKNDIGSLMKKNAEEHNYNGAFFGYTEEESFLNMQDIEDELSVASGFGTN